MELLDAQQASDFTLLDITTLIAFEAQGDLKNYGTKHALKFDKNELEAIKAGIHILELYKSMDDDLKRLELKIDYDSTT